ncbi:uncharacterized protein EDB91DRAFT_1243725 [Suillus paluster]|uniref:uncharacterized protein n=1 Tax=Suillus paluster TaxID=48578 RepID=UPI001B87EFF0|nr:uncharacterized protein EDB91DRAFT_1243725 [Suillus paluster]KAG1751464.1 hypothetical protein EDB91DRAFT_1243725 [Suillus paluster]
MLVMHPALRNLEVICTISSHTEYGSLPALASTCRAFEDSALNVLWKHLRSVEPLVKCLPGGLFGTDQGCVVLQKPLDDKMWETLARYTSRVHSITVVQFAKDTILPVIERLSLIMLSCPSAPASLFPNLRKLTWYADGTRGAADFLRMAFVPSLVEVNLRIASASSAFLSVLSSLGTLCPRLQSMAVRIHLAGNDSPRKISPFITQSISQLHYLLSLTVWDLGNEGMKRVMQLRALQSLSLDLTALSAWETWLHLQFPGFHDVRFLGLSVDAFERASNFLNSLQVLRSREFRVNYTTEAAVSHVRGGSVTLSQFFTILQKKCDNDKLERFSLIATSTRIHTQSGVFTSLHAFRNLIQLIIDRGCVISVSDEELCQLVRAWPKLKVLKISYHVAVDNTAVPTFHGLISLLRLCPALISLALVIDTTKLDGIDLKYPGGGSCNKKLKSLVLGNSPIVSPLNVALVLSGLFPCLEQVDLDYWDLGLMTFSPQKNPVMEQWALVNNFLTGFSVVRERRIEA